ncbi:MAG: Helix-turn-helix domain protein [Firmicutes bacterium ADurb.BinA052]|nr:MAG: Helix-turn-helix domain protein [Firmicutes bacterium ADurb.BinA052]
MEEMLTVAEVAGILRVSVRTVYNLLEAGALRGVRVGRAWRVLESALEDFIAKGGGERG